VFTAFDPVRGKGQELSRFATDPNAEYGNWSLSPDGKQIGIIKTGGNHTFFFRWTGLLFVTLLWLGGAG
jgi:hypothetical protein